MAFRVTVLIMGVTSSAYTTMGGIKAVTRAVQQMIVIMVSLVVIATAITLLPKDVFPRRVRADCGAAVTEIAVTTAFHRADRYTLWSGLPAGCFYAGLFCTDQSQVQRYLTGKLSSDKAAGAVAERDG